MGAQQSLKRYQDRKTLEAAAEGRLDGVVVARELFEARGLGLIGLPAGLVSRMAEAKTVDVSENAIDALPARICTLSDLQILIAHDNRLTSLPRSFGELFSLEGLDLSRNELSGPIPESIGSLKELRELRLQQNKYTALPMSIGNLVKLERLFVDHNGLTGMPETFTKVCQPMGRARCERS
jgi:hypothetical protein